MVNVCRVTHSGFRFWVSQHISSLHAFLASYLAKAELLVEKQVLDGVAGLGLEPGEMVALHYGKFGG
jgi:hypothetical protein